MPALWRVIAVIAGITAVATFEMWDGSGDSTAPVAGFPSADSASASHTTHSRMLVLGASSCFGSNCHGQPANQAGDSRSACAATLWIDHDRHTRAFEALEGTAAVQIMERLNPKGEGRRADEDVRCLACHTNPRTVYDAEARHVDTSPDVVASRREGVNCETCHGNPTHWLSEHATWQLDVPPDRLRARYESRGMTWLNDLDRRAELCAGCHVGAPEDREHAMPLRDVTHDLIAAGHPRLVFEFQSYTRNMPPHWKERDRAAKVGEPGAPRSAAQFWVAGQKACIAAATRLLEDSKARPGSPEFARLSCFACHHDLDAQSWRQTHTGGAPGRLQRDSWNFFICSRPRLSDALASIDPKKPSEAKDLLRATLLDFTSDECLAGLQWDHAAQIYLALVAWKSGDRSAPSGFDSNLWQLEDALRFPQRDGIVFNSPNAYEPIAIAPLLRSLRQMIETWNEKDGSRPGE